LNRVSAALFLCNLWPRYGDGFVNYPDFAVFARAWSNEVGQGNYDPGCEMSEPADGVIDARDLAVFAGSWLAGIE